MPKKSGDRFKEVRLAFLLSLFLAIVPLLLFPRSFGLIFRESFLVLLGFELGYYLLVWFFLLPKVKISRIALLVLISLIFRFWMGTIFGIFLSSIKSLNLFWSLQQAWLFYAPSILLQVLATPFVLKPAVSTYFKSRTYSEPGYTDSATVDEKILQVTAESKDFFLTSHKEGKEFNLDYALSYVKNYQGVKGCLLVDEEGLVVAKNTDEHFDLETYAPLAILLKDSNLSTLKKIGEKDLLRLEIFTHQSWLSLHKLLNFFLVTVASRSTDELLHIRISKTAEMIKKYIQEKYNPQALVKSEEIYVSDLRRT